jgi:signal transduction histidine kinase
MAHKEVGMVDGQAKTVNLVLVQRGTMVQLFFCYGIIVIVILLTRANMLFVLCACLLSFLLMLNIPYKLYMLEMVLDRLAHGLTVEALSLRWNWPLTHLYSLANMLVWQAGQQMQAEQLNVTYRDQLLHQVRKTAAQEERNRLARDLHDSIKQQLFSIVVNAAAIKARWENNLVSARKVVDDIERIAQETQVEMQALLQQLRPAALENVGLIESLRMQCQALSYRTSAEVTVELDELPPDELFPVGAQEMIFRVVQEGFANIARHARAEHIWLSLRRQRNALLVEIGDDGQGFDLTQANEDTIGYGGMGLSNMRERISSLGGTVAIWSLPGHGTTIHLCIPLAKSRIEEREQKQNDQQLVHALAKPRRILRVGTWMAELAAAFLLLYTPPSIARWPVLICTLVALACWLWVYLYRPQITLDFGSEREQYLLLQGRSWNLLAGILLLCMLYLNDFVPYFLFSARNIWSVTSCVILASAVILTYRSYARNINRYCRTLSRDALQRWVRKQLQEVIVDWCAWSIMVMIAVSLLNFFPLIDQVTRMMGYILLFAWLLSVIMKSIDIMRWQNWLNKGAEELVIAERDRI